MNIINNTTQYSRDFVWQKFKNKNYPTAAARELEDLKKQADKMADYILSGGIPASKLDETYKAWMAKKGLNKLTDVEKHARVFALSLKVIQQFKTFKGELGISKSSISKKERKNAPFIKLFGPEAKFDVLKSVNSKLVEMILLRSLGKGAHNAAHLVYGINYGETVLRSLKPEVLENKVLVKRWVSDSTIHQKLLNLKIPGIVDIRDIFVIDEKHKPIKRSMLMEKCDGDLNKICGKISNQQAKKIMKQILTTISQMHANGFVHGDLKPGNILYVNSPEGVITKLGDFETTERASQGWSGTNTPAYVTPQGWLNENIGAENTKKQDCFALGFIAFQLEKGVIFSTVARDYRSRLRENHALKDLLNQFKHQEINRDELLRKLSELYPKVPEFNKILDEKTLEMLNEKIDDEKFLEILNKCRKGIIQFEFEKPWEQSFKNLLNNLLVQNPSPYHRLIAQLLNPDASQRITAQEALAKLNMIIEEDLY